MTAPLSTNTQAILLLTAPLLAGRSEPSSDLLTPTEYKRLARHLHQLGREPADLLSTQADAILRESPAEMDASRLKRLLGRGFALSQAVERWQTRAIWVVSRADPEYPQRLKDRLREDRPAVLYGCGERALLDSGGLAVVGSRDVDEALIEYTESIGRLAAKARKNVVSGGARGIDQAAMRGALEAGGNVSGVLADSLEKTAMTREHRNMVLDGQLVLISPYDPGAGFNVGNAMQRNKLIYALADAALIVSSDFNKGGTWTGAAEQLDKLKFVPIYVRSGAASSQGLDALRRKGAMPWPNPEDRDGLDQVFSAPISTPILALAQETLFGSSAALPVHEELPLVAVPQQRMEPHAPDVDPPVALEIPASLPREFASLSPSDTVFAAVRSSISEVLKIPKKETEIAAELKVTPTQLRDWLQRLIEEGAVEKGPKKSLYQLPGRLI